MGTRRVVGTEADVRSARAIAFWQSDSASSSLPELLPLPITTGVHLRVSS